MIAVVFWFVAWLFAGTPPAPPWSPWFMFFLAAAVLSISQGLASITPSTTLVERRSSRE